MVTSINSGAKLLTYTWEATLKRYLPAPRRLKVPLPRDLSVNAGAALYANQVYVHSLAHRFDRLLTWLKEINPQADTKLVRRAFIFAAECHAGRPKKEEDRYRKSGLPYIDHPLGVAEIATAEAGIGDEATIAAILLHDVLEDTACTRDELKKEFGPEITKLVEGVSKYKKEIGSIRNRANLEKNLEFTQEDPRDILIKICDRLHNMRTLKYQSSEKQIEIAEETIEIWAPLANQLGLRILYRELQDLALSYLRPEEFKKVKADLEKLWIETQAQREKIADLIFKELSEEKVNEDRTIDPPVIKSRDQIIFTPRRPFEVFEQEKHRGALEVRPVDVFSLSVLVENAADTARVLGRICRLEDFTPLEKTNVTLINHPSPNGYEANHIRLLSPYGLIRIQTTTFKKHLKNERGIVAESYADPKWHERTKPLFNRWLVHLRRKGLKVPFGVFRRALRLAGKEIRVFAAAPGKKAIAFRFSYGATALDLAYALQLQFRNKDKFSEIGFRAASCMINGEPAELGRLLANNDRVHITTDERKTPILDDYKILYTLEAIEQWRQYFIDNLNMDPLNPLGEGRIELTEVLQSFHLKSTDFEREEILGLTRIWLNRIRGFRKISGNDKDNFHVLMRQIGEGDFSAEEVAAVFRKMFERNKQRMARAKEEITKETLPRRKKWIERERKRTYKFIIKADIPDKPGILGNISSAIGELGLNISHIETSGPALKLEVEIVWPLHEIQVQRIVESLGEVKNLKTETKGKPKKKGEK